MRRSEERGNNYYAFKLGLKKSNSLLSFQAGFSNTPNFNLKNKATKPSFFVNRELAESKRFYFF